jgi:uncharacterized phage protein (TIGR02218 family)
MSSIVEGDLTSIAMCWRLERADGTGLALTSHDQPVVSGGTDYQPEPGMVPAAITRGLGLDPQSGEAAGALSSETLDPDDLALGRWDGARVTLSAADWQDPAAEPIVLLGGEIGSVSIDGDSFTADLNGAAAKLQNPVCPATSAECRAHFGDKQCQVDLAGRTTVARIVSAVGSELTLDASFDEKFVLGRLRYLAGSNCGVSTTILAVNGATVSIRDLPRAAVESGCKVELREGCDKRFQTCVQRFANAANFRGEPYLPGNDLLTRYPGA